MRDDNKNEKRSLNARKSGVESLATGLMSKLDLPEDAAGAEPCIRMLGRHKLWIENHRGVLELGKQTVRLYTALGILRISGEELDIKLADRETVHCDGIIKSIEYEN